MISGPRTGERPGGVGTVSVLASTLPPDGRARADAERPWALADLAVLAHAVRAVLVLVGRRGASGRTLLVLVEVPGLPTALGALDWMLRAAGATDIIHE